MDPRQRGEQAEEAFEALRSLQFLGKKLWESSVDATKKHRIWAQGATDQVGHRNYLAQLLPHMKACTDPDFEIEFKTMTPSVTTVHALSEARVARAVIRGAITAEREGYDVFFMNHFQDVGLYDARATVKLAHASSFGNSNATSLAGLPWRSAKLTRCRYPARSGMANHQGLWALKAPAAYMRHPGSPAIGGE